MRVADLIFSSTFLATIIRMTTPIMFASLAGVVVARAGMMNLAIESTMLTGALAGVLFSAWTQSAWLGLLARDCWNSSICNYWLHGIGFKGRYVHEWCGL